ncbi:MAG: carboxymuconolactone decarboxylase family protein [Proteobacteria bacterium]|nr:carboxymuconolactone decarboxylase family protein [Pseudomonadota bacterium]
MARVPVINPENAPDELKHFYEAVTGLVGRVPNAYRTMAHAPYLAMLFLPFQAANQREWPGVRMSGKIKEMVIIKTSHINGCEYCYAHNTALGEAAGITHDQVIAMSSDDYLASDLFDERERAALEWAEHMTKNTAASRDDVYDRLKAQFSDAEIVELTLICSMFNMINRFNDSLKLTIENQAEVDKIRGTVHIDPANIKTYLRWLADNWPDDFDDLNERAGAAADAAA